MIVLLDEYCHKKPLLIDPNPKYIYQSEKGDRERERERERKKKGHLEARTFPRLSRAEEMFPRYVCIRKDMEMPSGRIK